MTIKHKFISTKPQATDPTKVSKNEWNDDHDAIWTGIGYNPDLLHLLGEMLSAGWIAYENINGYNGITDGGGGNINVAIAEGVIRSADVVGGNLYPFRTAALSNQAIPTDTTRYVYVDYNAGSPITVVGTTEPPNNRTYVYLGEVHNLSGTLQIHNDPRVVSDTTNRLLLYIAELHDTRVISGEVVTDPTPPSRKIKITAGVFWDRFLRRLTTSLFDTSGTDTMTKVYRNGVGEFTRVSGQTQWENTQYDDNSGTPATLPANYYANIWVVRGFFGDVYYMLGQGAYLNFALKPVTVTTYTKTFTADGVLKATKTKTFTVDAILRATLSKTFTADAILKATKTKTFTADAILSSATTYYKTFTADAILKKSGIVKTFTADGLLEKQGLTKTFTADAVLAKIATKTFTADAVLKATKTKTFTADALLKASGILKTFTADAILSGIDYISYGSPFIYNSANWGTVNFYLEVYMRATSGTVYARLYDITAASPVANSAVSTASATLDRVRSGAVTLTNNNLYRVQFGKISPAAGEFLGGKMVVV